MENKYWFYGLVSTKGQTPTIFHFEPVELQVVDGKFTAVEEQVKPMLDNFISNYPIKNVGVWSQATANEDGSIRFTTFVSERKEEINNILICSEVILRAILEELTNG